MLALGLLLALGVCTVVTTIATAACVRGDGYGARVTRTDHDSRRPQL